MKYFYSFWICFAIRYFVGATDVALTKDLNGQVLIDLGIQLNKPLLQLLGRVIRNAEEKAKQHICDLHPCAEWATWSKCSAKRIDEFGVKYRSRECGRNPVTCVFDGQNTIEEDSQICTGLCPDNYNLTKMEHCVRLHKYPQTSQSEAVNQCNREGGHLVKIDKEPKYVDINEFVLKDGTTEYFWVDGTRKDKNSPWVYYDGSEQGFVKWDSGQPDSPNNTELCLVVRSDGSKGLVWHDGVCSAGFGYMCEKT